MRSPTSGTPRCPNFRPTPKGLASRESSGQALNAVAQGVPWLVGGAADLAPSTKTRLTFDGAGDFSPADRGGRNFHFGVREFASAAIANGLALSKLRPFWSGFLIFSDYARGAIRLSALMEIPVIHVFTHDSIGVGEDGPTHQPVEQLASLRAMPGLLVFRPADANEVAETWRYVMELRHEPAVLVLSRQALPTVDRAVLAAPGVAKGAYVLADADTEPDVVLIATGSEVSLALVARAELAEEGIGARVVSMPCSELFDRQPQEYRDAVLPPSVTARVAIEQASALGWARYVGDRGAIVAMNTFGASAPLKELVAKFGFTPRRRDRGRARSASMSVPLRERPAWGALERHYAEIRDLHLRDLFAEDATRGERLAAEGAGLYLDYSKNRVTDETLRLLVQLADESGLPERTDAMFRGDRINTTENRSVLHVALRMPRERSLVVDGIDVVAQVHETLDRMAAFAERIRSGDWKGHTGKPIRNVVNVGIGGSDLGPVMAYEALRHYTRRDLTFRFVSNVDSHRLRRGDARPRAGRDPLRHLLEDVHDARDDDERALGARVDARGARRRGRGREALRRRLDERGRGREVRHRPGEHVRLLGLGRRPLLDGLGDRPLDDARDRARLRSATCSPASTRWTSTSARRRSSATSPRSWACSASGTRTSSARRRPA